MNPHAVEIQGQARIEPADPATTLLTLSVDDGGLLWARLVASGPTDPVAIESFDLGQDAQAAQFGIAAGSVIEVVNVAGTFDRARAVDGGDVTAQQGILAAAQPLTWAIRHAPAANTRATISRAASDGFRHVCTDLTVSLTALAAAAELQLAVQLRDGATGAGTILWDATIIVIPGGLAAFALSGLSKVGSNNTAMTLEFSAAGGANTIESVALGGYTIPAPA